MCVPAVREAAQAEQRCTVRVAQGRVWSRADEETMNVMSSQTLTQTQGQAPSRIMRTLQSDDARRNNSYIQGGVTAGEPRDEDEEDVAMESVDNRSRARTSRTSTDWSTSHCAEGLEESKRDGGDEDDVMESVASRSIAKKARCAVGVDGRIAKASMLPECPSYRRSTVGDRRKFIEAYRRYLLLLKEQGTEDASMETSGVQGGDKSQALDQKRVVAHKVMNHAEIESEEAMRLGAEDKTSKPSSRAARLQSRHADTLLAELPVEDVELEVARRDRGKALALIEDHVELDALLDTGADVSMVSKGAVERLVASGKLLEITQIPSGLVLNPLGDGEIVVTRKIRLRRTVLKTTAGPLVLQSVQCWIHEEDAGQQLILGRPVMNALGYTTDGLLVSALRKLGAGPIQCNGEESEKQVTYRDDLEKSSTVTVPVSVLETEVQTLVDVMQLGVDEVVSEDVSQLEVDEFSEDDSNEMIERMSSYTAPVSMACVPQPLLERREDALAAVLIQDVAECLEESIRSFDIIFRLALGCDSTADVELLKVRLKFQGQPMRCQASRISRLWWQTSKISPRSTAYVIQQLLIASLQPRVATKALTEDLLIVNRKTSSLLWSKLFSDGMLMHLTEAVWCLVFNAAKECWQHTLQEQPQGLYGVVGHASTPMKVMIVLYKAFAKCCRYDRVLNPKKCECTFYATEDVWGGRTLLAEGVEHGPERISGLVGLSVPKTAADLQLSGCEGNWTRSSTPRNLELVVSLLKNLEFAAQLAGSGQRTARKRVDVRHGLWTHEQDNDVFKAVKVSRDQTAQYAHRSPDATMCTIPNASIDHWDAAGKRLVGDEDKVITEREHKSIASLSGSSVGSAYRWPVEQVFDVTETSKRLVRRLEGFRWYTDHRDLVYVFDSCAMDSAMPRQEADKLQRWSTVVMMLMDEIYHVSGDVNVWASMLSRCGARVEYRVVRGLRAQALVKMGVLALQDPKAVWLSLEETGDVEQAVLRAPEPSESLRNVRWSSQDRAGENETGQARIPEDNIDLQQRVCFIAHAEVNGHHGQTRTWQVNGKKLFWIMTHTDIAQNDMSRCFRSPVQGEMVPRSCGSTRHATKSNKEIHFDNTATAMTLGNETYKHVPVVKDMSSNLVELNECASTDAEAFRALAARFNRFGVTGQWVSGQGSHFENMVTENLRCTLGSQHHFVSAYCPWSNETVEVVNRMLLKVMKSLVSELKLVPSEWPRVLLVALAALNSMPADKLGGGTPLTAFTQLPSSTPLSRLFRSETKENVTVEWTREQQRQHLKDTVEALEQMHRQLSEGAERRRQTARARRKDKYGIVPATFSVDDFVLVGQVITHANKLALRWRGPRRITRVIHDFTSEVKNLVAPFGKTEHHASWVRGYAEKDRQVASTLEDHVKHTEGGSLVGKFLEARMGPDPHQPEVHVEWIGLEMEATTWKRAAEFVQGVSVLIRRMAPQVKDPSVRKAISKLLAQHKTRGEGQVTPKAKQKQSKTRPSARPSARQRRGRPLQEGGGSVLRRQLFARSWCSGTKLK